MSSRRSSSGFTLIELITIMILLGILAVVVVPKVNSALSFRSVEFHDKVIAALRFAQKTATSHRRLVCVGFTANSVTLTIDHDNNKSCDGQPLLLPGGGGNVVQGADSSSVFATTPGSVYFQPHGQGTDASGNAVVIGASIDGMGVYMEGATGYVGDAR